ncbi:MAG: flagellar motor switch protein FliG [Treponema sp.]|jgi:flagellar motor switch protein FliG|nr:flagellar motor switch protein FliG [Treponema sp.]
MGAGKRNGGGFLKTTGEAAESKYRRAAKFLILIGSDRASEILSRLESEQAAEIAKAIAGIKGVTAEEAEGILDEFRSLLSACDVSRKGLRAGGVEEARRMLYAAFGSEKGEEILLRAAPEARLNPFDFLEDFAPADLALLFKEESASAAALVFSRLPPKRAAAALTHFTGAKKLEIARRIARQAPVAPEVLEQVASALREKARHIGAKDTGEGFDGVSALAAILKSADISFGGELLDTLERNDPELGKNLKEKLYTLDDVVRAADLPLQKKLASMDTRGIVLLLRAAPGDAFREKIRNNLSSGRQREVLEEDEIIGIVPKRETAEAAAAFLAWFRQRREEGGLIMQNDGDGVL